MFYVQYINKKEGSIYTYLCYVRFISNFLKWIWVLKNHTKWIINRNTVDTTTLIVSCFLGKRLKAFLVKFNMKAIIWQVFPSNSKEKPKNTRYSGDYRNCESNQTKNYCTYVKKHNKKVLICLFFFTFT